VSKIITNKRQRHMALAVMLSGTFLVQVSLGMDAAQAAVAAVQTFVSVAWLLEE